MTSQLDALLTIACDLTAALTATDRYRRLLESVRQLLPCDAAALLRLEADEWVPLSAHGLVDDALGRRFRRGEHARLDLAFEAREPVIFDPHSPLPDPFDGLLAGDATAGHRIHSCLVCPLVVEGQVVGALTADAVDPQAFSTLDRSLLATLGALAGAAVRTTTLIEGLERAAERQGLVARELARDAATRSGGQLLGSSPAMVRLRREIELVGRDLVPVLITGETGVGKELVARAIHAASSRAHAPLIHVNCAALPETMAESELFGHVRGAFTGAATDRAGKFEVADGGTLFLDEIGELPMALQPKLLRALHRVGEIQRVGADRPKRVDVRVIAATNRDLEQAIAAGRFRADLYHRLNVYPVRVPPLRDRREDIAPLAGWFCEQAKRRLGLGPVRLSEAARRRLVEESWPGNVRELENVIARAVLRAAQHLGPGEPVVLEPAHLGSEFEASPMPPVVQEPERAVSGSAATLREAVDAYQRQLILRAVHEQGGNWAAAARALGMHRANLHHLAQRLGLRE